MNSVCPVQRPSVFLTLSPQGIDWGMHKRLGVETTREMTQTNQRNIVWHMMLCSAIKRERKGFSMLAIFCSGTVWTSVYPWEVVSDCVCIICFVFSFSLLLLHLLKFFIFTYNFSCFYSPFIFPHPTEAGWVVLSCLLRLTNSSGIF